MSVLSVPALAAPSRGPPLENLLSRAPLVRAMLALTVFGLSLFAALTQPARLGLDLRGGTQIVLDP